VEVVRVLLLSFADDYVNRPLVDKQAMLREKLSTLKAAGGDGDPVHITVRRDQLLEGLCGLVNHDWSVNNGVDVEFSGENSSGDGLRREYLRLVTAELLQPEAALFQCTASEGEHAHRVQPLPDSGVANADHLSYFEMFGKLVGLGILQGECLPGELPLVCESLLLLTCLLSRGSVVYDALPEAAVAAASCNGGPA
jgi:hypothetical protein